MSYQIEQSYFQSHFNNDANEYELEGGYYKRTIAESDLVLGWDDANDDLTLSYTIRPDNDGFSIGGGEFVRFAEEEVRFECRYPRQIDTTDHHLSLIHI